MPTRVPRVLASAAKAAASVVAVVLLLLLPARLSGEATSNPVPPTPPTSTEEVEALDTTAWTALECPLDVVGCPVPTVMNVDGDRLLRTASHRQGVRRSDPGSRTLVGTVAPAAQSGSGHRWVLVGAVGASSASVLSVAFGNADSAPITHASLTLLPVPGSGPVKVTVADYGRISGHEVLHIEEYIAEGQ